jgi:hypothetical protein
MHVGKQEYLLPLVDKHSKWDISYRSCHSPMIEFARTFWYGIPLLDMQCHDIRLSCVSTISQVSESTQSKMRTYLGVKTKLIVVDVCLPIVQSCPPAFDGALYEPSNAPTSLYYTILSGQGRNQLASSFPNNHSLRMPFTSWRQPWQGLQEPRGA